MDIRPLKNLANGNLDPEPSDEVQELANDAVHEIIQLRAELAAANERANMAQVKLANLDGFYHRACKLKADLHLTLAAERSKAEALEAERDAMRGVVEKDREFIEFARPVIIGVRNHGPWKKLRFALSRYDEAIAALPPEPNGRDEEEKS